MIRSRDNGVSVFLRTDFGSNNLYVFRFTINEVADALANEGYEIFPVKEVVEFKLGSANRKCNCGNLHCPFRRVCISEGYEVPKAPKLTIETGLEING